MGTLLPQATSWDKHKCWQVEGANHHIQCYSHNKVDHRCHFSQSLTNELGASGGVKGCSPIMMSQPP